MKNFNGVELLDKENEIRNNYFENIINNIYNKLSTNYCEYVDNISNMYTKLQNTSKSFKTVENFNNNNVTERFQNSYNNILKNSYFTDNYRGFSGYVENFVDNRVKRLENFEVIHKNIDSVKNLCSDNTSITNDYKHFTDIIRNVENSKSYDNKSFGVNINLGGITQNITGTGGDDVLDILVDKLKNSISSCCDKFYG